MASYGGGSDAPQAGRDLGGPHVPLGASTAHGSNSGHPDFGHFIVSA